MGIEFEVHGFAIFLENKGAQVVGKDRGSRVEWAALNKKTSSQEKSLQQNHSN